MSVRGVGFRPGLPSNDLFKDRLDVGRATYQFPRGLADRPSINATPGNDLLSFLLSQISLEVEKEEIP